MLQVDSLLVFLRSLPFLSVLSVLLVLIWCLQMLPCRHLDCAGSEPSLCLSSLAELGEETRLWRHRSWRGCSLLGGCDVQPVAHHIRCKTHSLAG